VPESVHDVRAGIEALAGMGVARVALVGHSLGGAVVVEAACDPRVATVIAIATQTAEADVIRAIAPRALLLLHGTADGVLPWHASRLVYERALRPKRLRLLFGAGHTLDEAADDVHDIVRGWLAEHLPGPLRRRRASDVTADAGRWADRLR
jgi:dienelactone hydrolase